MTKTNSAILCLMLILSVGLISANVMVAGTVYGTNVSDTLANKSVSIQCDGEILDTHSKSDGAYMVIFGQEDCDVLTITCAYNFTNMTMDLSSPVVQDTSTSNSAGGGGSGVARHYYQCGNGICDSGETASTCPSDCSTSEGSSYNDGQSTIDLEEGTSSEEETGTLAGITGAAIGVITSNVGIAIIIFLIVLGAIYAVVRWMRKSK